VNIVEVIKAQLSGPALATLSSLIGSNENSTRSAIGVAVPSLLSSFSDLASSGGGAENLVDTLQRFDPMSPGSLAGLLNERPDLVAKKGSGIAESLLGMVGTSKLIHSLSGISGIASEGASKLLGFLTPTALGGIARQFSGKTLDAASLGSFFSDQKRNIAQALPTGPAGMGRVKGPAQEPAYYSAPSAGRWLLPTVLGIAAIAMAILLMRPKTTPPPQLESPDAFTRLSRDFQDSIGSLTGTLKGVTDAASAEAALPKVSETRDRLDEIRASAAQLPPEGRAQFDRFVQPQLVALQEQQQRIASIPGGGEKVKPVLDDALSRWSAPVGTPAERGQEVR
jgi:hypothetical protein